MDQVQKLTEELVAAIKECEAYVRYQNAKQELSRYPVLKERADEFLRRNYELVNGSPNVFEDGERLKQEFSQVAELPLVWEYLMAENALCRVLRQVSWKLLGSLEFEVDFLGE